MLLLFVTLKKSLLGLCQLELTLTSLVPFSYFHYSKVLILFPIIRSCLGFSLDSEFPEGCILDLVITKSIECIHEREVNSCLV